MTQERFPRRIRNDQIPSLPRQTRRAPRLPRTPSGAISPGHTEITAAALTTLRVQQRRDWLLVIRYAQSLFGQAVSPLSALTSGDLTDSRDSSLLVRLQRLESELIKLRAGTSAAPDATQRAASLVRVPDSGTALYAAVLWLQRWMDSDRPPGMPAHERHDTAILDVTSRMLQELKTWATGEPQLDLRFALAAFADKRWPQLSRTLPVPAEQASPAHFLDALTTRLESSSPQASPRQHLPLLKIALDDALATPLASTNAASTATTVTPDTLAQAIAQRLGLRLAQRTHTFTLSGSDARHSVVTPSDGPGTIVCADTAADKEITLSAPDDALILRNGIRGKITVHLPPLATTAGADRRGICIESPPDVSATPDFQPPFYRVPPRADESTVRFSDTVSGGLLTLTGQPGAMADRITADIAIEQSHAGASLARCLHSSGLSCATHPTTRHEIVLDDLTSATPKLLQINNPACDIRLMAWPSANLNIDFDDSRCSPVASATAGRFRLDPGFAPLQLRRSRRDAPDGRVCVELTSVNSPHAIRLTGKHDIIDAQTQDIETDIAIDAGFSLRADPISGARDIIVDGDRTPQFIVLDKDGDKLSIRRFRHYLSVYVDATGATLDLDGWMDVAGAWNFGFIQRPTSDGVAELDIFQTNALCILTLRAAPQWCAGVLRRVRHRMTTYANGRHDHNAPVTRDQPLDLNALAAAAHPGSEVVVHLDNADNISGSNGSHPDLASALLLQQQWDPFSGQPMFDLLPLAEDWCCKDPATGKETPPHVAIDYVVQNPLRTCLIFIYAGDDLASLKACNTALQQQLDADTEPPATLTGNAGTLDHAVLQSRPTRVGSRNDGQTLALPKHSLHPRRLIRLNNTDDSLQIEDTPTGSLCVDLPTAPGNIARTVIDITRLRSSGNGHNPPLLKQALDGVVRYINPETAFVMTLSGASARIEEAVAEIDSQIANVADRDVQRFKTDERDWLSVHPDLDESLFIEHITGIKTIRVNAAASRINLIGAPAANACLTLELPDEVLFENTAAMAPISHFCLDRGMLHISYANTGAMLRIRTSTTALAPLLTMLDYLSKPGGRADTPVLAPVCTANANVHAGRYAPPDASLLGAGMGQLTWNVNNGYAMVMRDVDLFLPGTHRTTRRRRHAEDEQPAATDEHISMMGATLVFAGSGLGMNRLHGVSRFLSPAAIAAGSALSTYAATKKIVLDIRDDDFNALWTDLPLVGGNAGVFSAYLLHTLNALGVIPGPIGATARMLEIAGVTMLVIGGTIQTFAHALDAIRDPSPQRLLILGGDAMVTLGTAAGGAPAFTAAQDLVPSTTTALTASAISNWRRALMEINELETSLHAGAPRQVSRLARGGFPRYASVRRRPVFAQFPTVEEVARDSVPRPGLKRSLDLLHALTRARRSISVTPAQWHRLASMSKPGHLCQARLAIAGAGTAAAGNGVSLYCPLLFRQKDMAAVPPYPDSDYSGPDEAQGARGVQEEHRNGVDDLDDVAAKETADDLRSRR